MKALPFLLLVVALGSVPADSAFLALPDSIRRGEPAFVSLAAVAGEPSGYGLSVQYADGAAGPRYIGFKAPVPPARGGRDVVSAGSSSAERSSRAVLFLISVPIDAVPGDATVTAFDPGGRAIALARFTVADRTFAREDLPLNQALTSIRVDPDPRKTEQARRYQAVLSSADPSAAFLEAGFVRPVQTERRTSLFGQRRRYLYSDGAVDVSTHNGIDYGCPVGTPVAAAGAGRVVMAEDRIVTGKTVIIEHAPGAFTIYMHLDTMAVLEGAVVSGGAFIGTVGMTGLATGPHLHWEFRVMGAAADPEALVGLDKMPTIRTIAPAIEGG